MTPKEAREIDRLEFEADCRAARERAYALIAERRATSSKTKPKANTRNAPAEDRIIVRRSHAKLYAVDGKSMTMAEWSAMCGHSVPLLHARLRAGMTIEQAITTPKLKASVPWKDQLDRSGKAGVVQSFDACLGTGAGCRPQDIPQIEIFSE